MFDEIDDELEQKYGSLFPLHPNRVLRGKTANKEMDGLFNIGANFTLGYGSACGRGYVIHIGISTLEHVPVAIMESIQSEVESMVNEKLPSFFPGRTLQLERDGNLLKITGNFGLGSVIQK